MTWRRLTRWGHCCSWRNRWSSRSRRRCATGRGCTPNTWTRSARATWTNCSPSSKLCRRNSGAGSSGWSVALLWAEGSTKSTTSQRKTRNVFWGLIGMNPIQQLIAGKGTPASENAGLLKRENFTSTNPYLRVLLWCFALENHLGIFSRYEWTFGLYQFAKEPIEIVVRDLLWIQFICKPFAFVFAVGPSRT